MNSEFASYLQIVIAYSLIGNCCVSIQDTHPISGYFPFGLSNSLQWWE